jgi:hypothetical protein
MLIDGFQLLEQSSITNLVVSNGDTFPTAPTNTPDIGELFYKTSASVGFPIGLYYYDGTDWQQLVVNSSLGTTTIDSGASFPVSPTDGELFYKSASDGNGELGLYVYTLSDTTWHITASSTTLTNHIADASVHLTSGQNTLLDNITVSSTEINYLSGVSSNVQTQISDKLSKTGGTMTGNIIVSTGSHISVADAPVSGTDAVNKNYVDANMAGLTWKNSVKVATTANITLSGTQTIDGIAVIAGDRVLVKAQSTASQNGIYVVASGTWVRATDMDATTPVNELNSAAVFVEQGTVFADTGWTQINLITTLETDAIAFTQFNGAANITAGIGLDKSGNELFVKLGAGISQLPTDEIGVDVYATGGLMTTVDGDTTSTLTGAQLSLVKVGTAGTYKSITTDAYGRVTAGSNPTTLAGYGITDAAPISHVSDETIHLSSAQNIWLDAITASSAEVNYLSGVTSNIQTQLGNKQPLDADLTAIAALTGTVGFLKTNGAGTWTAETTIPGSSVSGELDGGAF